jgi:hypothetical protein
VSKWAVFTADTSPKGKIIFFKAKNKINKIIADEFAICIM